MASIGKADYETISITCDLCKTKLCLNRRDDLRELSQISGRSFTCTVCHGEFWITGDTVNSAFEMFIFAADEHFAAKRNMLAVMSVAQAWELFLATFAYSNYTYRPFWAEKRHAAAVDELNTCIHALNGKIKRFALKELCNFASHTVLRRLHPRTLAEAASMIDHIRPKEFRADPDSAEIAALADSELGDALHRLGRLQVSSLRNKVAHKQAYRPSRDEVIPCLEDEVVFLHHIRDLFGVGDFDEFGAGVVEVPRWFGKTAEVTLRPPL